MKKHVVQTFSSPYNGDIELVEGTEGYSLVVDDVTQSGPDIEAIWDEAFEKLIPDSSIKKILILGFGAGSIVKPIRARWPQSSLTAIEIDSIMVSLARDYFPDQITDVDVTTTDAVTFIQSLKDDASYDLIIVDCYIGATQPEDMKVIDFLRRLKKYAPQILFNQLFMPGKRSEMSKIAFLRILDRYYSVRAIKLPYNIIISY